MDPYSLRILKDTLGQRRGLIVVSGPEKSGKTTTLLAALRSVMKANYNTVTIEEPVDYLLEGARQIRLSHKLQTDDALRALLRHDPDHILIGEIRDTETADLALRLAVGGHLTFSTVLATDSVSVIDRLLRMGVEPFLLSQGLSLVLSQRLVRKLCERCKERVMRRDFQQMLAFGMTEDEIDGSQFFRPVGCINCIGGYKGRVPIFETLAVTPMIREIVANSTDVLDAPAVREAAHSHGMLSLRKAGVQLLKGGATSFEEIASALA
jgi:type IV pilus assembly protein PilB